VLLEEDDVDQPDPNAERQHPLFEMPSTPDVDPPEPAVRTPEHPVWTDNKARFIMRYLRYFVFITKHGTYIDGFAGPQEECETDSWAAKLVLESEPRWIRHVHLCDAKASQVKRLKELAKAQPTFDVAGKRISRDIHVYKGDFNKKVDEILALGDITEKEATFCLLDQRTFECDWATVAKLALFKTKGHKIELFYFLANSWLERALSGQKDLVKLARWWGRDDWTQLKAMSRDERRNFVVQRFKTEFRYKSVKPWPIYERENGGAVMYYMIHGTDHPEAPKQMSRAYRNIVFPFEPVEQLKLELVGEYKAPGPAVPVSLNDQQQGAKTRSMGTEHVRGRDNKKI
jgi:three-Cys-motif partner protein